MHKPENKKLLALQKIAGAEQTTFRPLTNNEITTLKRQNNHAENWNYLYIDNSQTVQSIHNCSFYGVNYIACISPGFTISRGIRRARGLYNSYFENCMIGEENTIHNAGHVSGYVIKANCLIINTNEISCSEDALFGMGTKLEVINENGNRPIHLFRDMTIGDIWLTARHPRLKSHFNKITSTSNESRVDGPGYIDAGTVIKNCRLIHNCMIGAQAFLHETEYLSNLTILSSDDEPTEIGEGVGLKNGLIGYANTIHSGVRCDTFMTGRNVSISNVARIGHTAIGDNSHIACAEIMNSLLFPFHEQHHNNSFLIAAAIGGQANIAAGATIGSNHNSRAADGEIWADRGFWPGLVTNFKHNSRFAAFTLIAKANYDQEMNIPFPFCLVSRSPQNGQLTLLPAYWFMYNMYALSRNAWKFNKRDKRIHPRQIIETGFMAPDTIFQIVTAVKRLQESIGAGTPGSILIPGISPKQKTLIIKPVQAIAAYKQMLTKHAAYLLTQKYIKQPQQLKNFRQSVSKPESWVNIGGQLIPFASLAGLLKHIEKDQIHTWDEIHNWYRDQAAQYDTLHLRCALNGWAALNESHTETLNIKHCMQILKEGKAISAQILQKAREARQKDYHNDFRKMCYTDGMEMEMVLGRLDDNPFLTEMQQTHQRFCDNCDVLLKNINT